MSSSPFTSPMISHLSAAGDTCLEPADSYMELKAWAPWSVEKGTGMCVFFIFLGAGQVPQDQLLGTLKEGLYINDSRKSLACGDQMTLGWGACLPESLDTKTRTNELTRKL